MARPTSPLSAHPSSSWLHQTPSLSHSKGVSSSSPASEVLATPTDVGHYHTRRSRKSATAANQTNRTRTASNGLSSSPHIVQEDFAKPQEGHLTDDVDESALAPPLQVPVRTRSRGAQQPPSRPSSTKPSEAELDQVTNDTLALAQRHGITPDQFEKAKEQVMRFLRSDAPAAAAAAQSTPEDKGKGKATFGRSASMANVNTPAVAADPDATFALGTPLDPSRPGSSTFQPSLSSTPHQATLRSPRTVRTKPSLEQMVQRSGGRGGLREWAAEAGSESSSDDEGAAREVKSALVQSNAVTETPINPGANDRGMMERLLSVRPVRDADAPNARARGLSPTTSPAVQRGGRAKHQPAFSPDMHTSPVPSRGNPASLFSPDVARLLRSELDELEANELNGRKLASQGKLATLQHDNFSSPFASAPGKRTRDIFSVEDSAPRRTWDSLDIPGDRAPSPTPSAASGSIRAPSFCDSSPAVSEEKVAVATRAPESAHSSSPASSQASLSDYQSGPKQKSVTSEPSRKRTSARQVETPAAAVMLPKFKKPSESGTPSNAKPSWSYAALIGQAIFSTPIAKISLNDIYSFIMTEYPYYKKGDSGWQNSIRHNLSLNECFVKTQRGPENPGKGCLWAVVPGCEDQFADGGFAKRGGSGNGRKTKPVSASKAPSSSGSIAPVETPVRATRGLPMSRTNSRVPTRDQSPLTSPEQSPALSALSVSRHSPPPPTAAQQQEMMQVELQRQWEMDQWEQQERARLAHEQQLEMMRQQQMREQHEHAIAMHEQQMRLAQSMRQPTPPPMLAPMHHPTPRSSSPRQHSISSSSKAKVERDELASPKRPKLEAAYEPSAAARRTPRSLPSLFTGEMAAAASPPTNVYRRLAGPYRPLYADSVMNHRALALLASPEASGIMPSRADDLRGEPLMPAPHIFGSGSKHRRTRTLSDEGDDERGVFSQLLSPSLVHTQSPISSMRGGPALAEPGSPSLGGEKPSMSSDPEKKRSKSHLPAVQALTDAAEMFGTPPRRHVRSPSGRGPVSSASALQSAMMTPGGRLGRPWHASPGEWGWDVFGARGQVEAELENLRREPPTATPGSFSRMIWPSPAPPAGTQHHHW